MIEFSSYLWICTHLSAETLEGFFSAASFTLQTKLNSTLVLMRKLTTCTKKMNLIISEGKEGHLGPLNSF